MHDNKTLRYLLGFTSIIIAICSASFSVYGLSLIFSGIAIAIMIMASVIELGKIVAVAFLYQRWRTINLGLRFFLGIMIVGAMTVTSLGIFGILSSGYEKAAIELNSQSSQIDLLNNKKSYFVSQIKNLENQKSFYEQRALQLSALRKNQEQRLDNIYQINSNTKSGIPNKSDKSTISLIKQTNIDIDSANKKADKIISKISQLNDSIQLIDEKMQLVIINNNKIGLDPLKYLSRISSNSIDSFIKWFIILLLSIFDPFAVILLMSFNQMDLDKHKVIEETKEKSSLFKKLITKLENKKDKSAEDNFNENIFTEENLKENNNNLIINESISENQNELEKNIENVNKNIYIEENKEEAKLKQNEQINLQEKEGDIKFEMNTTNKMETEENADDFKSAEELEKIAIEISKQYEKERLEGGTQMQPDGGMRPK